MERRNQDQVVSKELHGEDLKTREIRAWKLLRIDELFANSATTLNFARPSTHTSVSHIFNPVVAIRHKPAQSGKLVQYCGLATSLTSFYAVASTSLLVHEI